MHDKIQRRATILIPRLIYCPMKNSVKEFGITTLETRILRGIKCTLFVKILNGQENRDPTMFAEKGMPH